MKRFFALVHKDEDSAFGVLFPDFAGLFSAADEEENLIINATEALQLYCEDIDIVPIPSKFEEVIQRESVKKALSEGAFLIQVPFIENDAEVVRTNISIERGLLRAIDDCAQERGLTRSAFLATAARHELNI
ncbi:MULTISPECIES: type II toxin-antitoxin system HicB family antitoxin [unclassified Bartonella]|uniref:type II toxin-antitoxin system HicB family antitoxin n=1 Tax=unclassified Bartonella TaxID=2645622 RepID=UPI0035D04EC8